jgi:hypothetical protein
MRGFVAPALWLAAGAFAVFMWAHLSSDKYLADRTDEQRKRLRESFASPLHSLLAGAIAIYCLFATIATIWMGRNLWWMWLLATLTHLGVLVAHRRALGRLFAYLGERPTARTPQERTRQRYVISYTAMAVLAFAIARAVLPPPERADAEAAKVIVAVVLLVVAGLAALAAGWSAVWAFKEPGGPSSDKTTSGR